MNTRRKTVGEIVSGRETYAVQGDRSVLEVVRYMTERSIGAVSVVNGDGRLQGIFSERDLMTRVVAAGSDPSTTPVSTVMTRKVAVLSEDSSYDDALAIMNVLHIRHLPVIIDDRTAGCVSIRDLQQAEIEVKDREIEFLDDYIERIERAL
jgi:CBS domain-containing protein